MTELCLIGGGNMATALVAGLLKQDFPAAGIACADPSERAREKMREAAPGIQIFADNEDALAGARTVIFAVKPQGMEKVVQGAAPLLHRHRPLVISIAAGVGLDTLDKWVGEALPIVRCMPNTPALLGCGASVLFANRITESAQREEAQKILRAVGRVWWAEEEAQLDAVTAISGSGPAYFFLVIESLQQAAMELGLPQQISAELTVQTALGAARMAAETDVDVSELRRRVTSPGGVTERALQILQERDLRTSFTEAVRAGAERSRELASAVADH